MTITPEGDLQSKIHVFETTEIGFPSDEALSLELRQIRTILAQFQQSPEELSQLKLFEPSSIKGLRYIAEDLDFQAMNNLFHSTISLLLSSSPLIDEIVVYKEQGFTCDQIFLNLSPSARSEYARIIENIVNTIYEARLKLLKRELNLSDKDRLHFDPAGLQRARSKIEQEFAINILQALWLHMGMPDQKIKNLIRDVISNILGVISDQNLAAAERLAGLDSHKSDYEKWVATLFLKKIGKA